jgi:sugar phosphate isomerase/epimerase
MITRRKFLGTLTAGSAALFAANPFLAACNTEKKLKDYGYISGIIGKELKGDWKAVLKETVDYGYTEIETGNFLGDSAEAFLEYCNSIGIKPVAGGTVFTDDMDKAKASFEKLNELKVQYAVSYWPWQGGEPFSLENCKKSVEILNKLGEQSKSQGLTLCWHNHNHEFKAMEEGLPFDYLMNNTDADLVKCELDVYWVQRGGADPVEIMKKYPGRYPILHIKDMAPGEEQDFECVGNGIVDFPSIFREADKQGIKHFFVERDKVVDGMACLKSAAEYLEGLRF